MKQTATFCLASFMLCTSFDVDAKTSLKQAIEHEKEGMAFTLPFQTKYSQPLKSLKHATASPFHKIIAEGNVKMDIQKTPVKVNAQGDNIYGYLGYTTGSQAIGLYEFGDSQQNIIWEDNFANEVQMAPACLCLQDGVLKGYMDDISWGFLYGVYYVEYDFETGKNLAYEAQDMTKGATFMQSMALDSDEGIMYGFGYYNNALSFISAPVDEPFNYNLVGVPQALCMSLCYNQIDKTLYGVTTDYKFVSIDKTSGEFTELMTLDVKNGANYVTGLVYDPASKLFYWNINRHDDTAALATINLEKKELNVYEELSDGQQYIGMFSTDEEIVPGQPKSPVVGEVDFFKNNLIGFVSFTLPTESAYDDSEIEGAVKYKTYVDGQLYSTGNGKSGETVKANFAVNEGLHVFGMRAVVDGVESTLASVKVYVGNDVPLAPINVNLSATEATWTAVGSVGENGGYIDVSALKYNVYLNDELIATTSDTKQSIVLDPEKELSTYTVVVKAVCNGFESAPASSNTIVEGSAFNLPAYFGPTPEEFEISTVLDGNEDGSSWKLVSGPDGYYINSDYNRTLSLDEYFFLPPVKIEDVTKFYTFSMETSIGIKAYNKEYVEVLVCNEPSKEGIVGEVIPIFTPTGSGTNFEKVRGEFNVHQPGEYYIAIHAISAPDQYGVYCRNFSIEDNNITLGSPAVIEDIELVAGEKGALAATATITLPTLTLGGTEIPADSELQVLVSASNEVTVVGKPGEKVSATVQTEQGKNIVNFVVSLGDLNSPVVSKNVYTGVSVPAGVKGLTYEISEDNCSMTLSWKPVTEGDDGGYVDPETLYYDICIPEVSIFGTFLEIYDEGITDTSYTYTSDTQDLVTLTVVARNVAGSSKDVEIVSEVVGPPYILPMIDDFEDPYEAFRTQPWVLYTFSGYESPDVSVNYLSSLDNKYSGNDKSALIVKGWADAKGQLGMPKFTTKGVNGATATFNVCGDFFLPKATVFAEANGVEMEAIGEIVMEEEGFHEISIELPEKFLDKATVGLYIQYEFGSNDEVLAIESVNISNGSSVASLMSSDVKIVAGKNVINVSGLSGQDVGVATLDGRIAARAKNVANEVSFQLDKGVYVVEAGSMNAKVVVK